jgi:hypothetical protein
MKVGFEESQFQPNIINVTYNGALQCDTKTISSFSFCEKKAISFVEIHKKFNIFYHVKTFNIFNTNEFIFWLGIFFKLL